MRSQNNAEGTAPEMSTSVMIVFQYVPHIFVQQALQATGVDWSSTGSVVATSFGRCVCTVARKINYKPHLTSVDYCCGSGSMVCSGRAQYLAVVFTGVTS